MRELGEENKSLQYMNNLFAPETDLIKESSKLMEETGKAGMSVSPAEAKMLASFIRMFDCKKIVELGCFAGYSALWMADAMNGGDLYTFEFNKEHAEIAQGLFDKYEGDTSINLLIGDARDKLTEIEVNGPFDMVFIDANKAAYADYFKWADANLKVGGIVIGDNSLLFDQIGLDKPERVSKSQWQGMRDFNEALAKSDSYESFFIPTSEGMSVGRKLK